MITKEDITKARQIYEEIDVLARNYFNDSIKNWQTYLGWHFYSNNVVIQSFYNDIVNNIEYETCYDELIVDIETLLNYGTNSK